MLSMLEIPAVVRAALAFVVSATMTAAFLPLAARAAFALGAVDKPGGRRTHRAPVPRLGGVAVLVAAGLTCGLLEWLTTSGEGVRAGLSLGLFQSPQTPAVFAGALLVFMVGMLDDLRGAAPRLKLVVQTIAAVLVVRAGGLADALVLAKDVSPLHVNGLMPAITVLWIVGVTNAFNLIDGLDGLAGVCAIVALGTMVVSGAYLGQPSSFVFVLALLGALVVFLRRNWHPATVFLGDAGSMTIGFLLAVRSISSATSAQGNIHVLVMLAALCYPLADTATAMLRRWLRGHSFSRADGRHIHHQMVTIGMSMPRAVAVIGGVSLAVAAAALAISFAPPQLTILLAVGASMVLSVAAVFGIWRLGYTEFIAAGKAVYSGLGLSRRIVRERIRIMDLARTIKTATTEAEMLACVQQLVDGEHVSRAELVQPGDRRRSSRDDATYPSVPASTVQLECPVRRAVAGQELQLRVWINQKGVAHHTIQRVEGILPNELAAWFDGFDRRAGRVAPVTRESAPFVLVTPERTEKTA